MIAQSAARGVGSNERSLADFEGVVEGFVGNVRNVHHNALAVHFADDSLAKIGEPVVRRLVGGGIRPLVVVEVGEGHVAHAEIAKHAQHTNVVADHMAALDANERGDFPLGVRVADFVSSAAEDQVFRIFNDVLVHGINLIESFLHRGRTHDAAINPDGKENGVHASFAHARDIDVAIGVAPAEVEILGEEPLRRVVVRI